MSDEQPTLAEIRDGIQACKDIGKKASDLATDQELAGMSPREKVRHITKIALSMK